MHYILIFCLTTNLLVEPQPEMAKQYVVEILSQPEFKTSRDEYRLRYVGDSMQNKIGSTPLDFIKLVAQLAEILLWVVLFIIILIFAVRSFSLIRKSPSLFKPVTTKYSTTLVKDEKAKSLGTNISQQAWQLWQTGYTCAAMSLLYCGALSVLQNRYALNITDNITENECIKLVKLNQTENLANYFIDLTHVWQNIAYAGRPPDFNKAQELCEKWQQHFG